MRPPAKSSPSIPNGTRVDALGWDPAKKLIYIPNGGEGNVTVVHQDSADKYSVVATVTTFAGREDDHRRSEDAQRVSVPAGARSSAAAGARRAATGAGTGPRTRPAGADHRGVVHQDHALIARVFFPTSLLRRQKNRRKCLRDALALDESFSAYAWKNREISRNYPRGIDREPSIRRICSPSCAAARRECSSRCSALWCCRE